MSEEEEIEEEEKEELVTLREILENKDEKVENNQENDNNNNKKEIINNIENLNKDKFNNTIINNNKGIIDNINILNKDKNINNKDNNKNIKNNLNKNNNNNIINNKKKEKSVTEDKKDKDQKKENQKEEANYAKEFDKKMKHLENLSLKMDFVLDRINLSRKKRKEDLPSKIKLPNDKLLLEKELQLKNSSTMIINLTKENKRLREENDKLNKRLLQSDNLTLLEQISSKNLEIEKLKKKIIDVTKKYDQEKAKISTYETMINQSKEIIDRYKMKNFELKTKNESPNKNQLKSVEINKITRNIKKNKLIKSVSDINIKNKNNKIQNEFKTTHALIHSNFHTLLTDKEKASLKNLFESNDDFVSFMNKIYILETRNKMAENQYENEIKNLNKIIKDKDNKINELKMEITKKDIKINTLEIKLSEYKKKNQIFNNKQKKLLTVEEQLKEGKFDIKTTSNKEKVEKLNLLVNHYREELKKKYLEKCKEEEINNFNKEIGNIQFFDNKFFENLNKNK